MSRLVSPALIGLLAIAAVAKPSDEELTFSRKAYQIRPLQFEVAVPEGWNFHRDETRVLAQAPSPDGPGYRITREPFLHDPETFLADWKKQLAVGGVAAEVKAGRAGRYASYSARWESPAAGGRVIAVWRLHVPAIEMLYNVAFSVPKNAALDELTEGVLKSFRCTASKPKFKLEGEPERIGGGYSMRLPGGYRKAQAVRRSLEDPARVYEKLLPGYKPPHQAGTLRMFAYQSPRYGEVRGNDVKAMAQRNWERHATAKARTVPKKPRVKTGRAGPLKGNVLTVAYVDKAGLPKRFHAFGTRIRGTTLVFTLVVDEREIRLQKDLFRKYLGSFKED